MCVRQNRSAWASRAIDWCCCATGKPSGRCPASTPGRTDLDLTDNGRAQAVAAGPILADLSLDDPKVISSPRRRAVDTAELAGLTVDEKSELLAEWDYGSYEGLTSAEIHKSHPSWSIWTHGCPGGEIRGTSQRARGPGRRHWRWSSWRRVTWCSWGMATFPAPSSPAGCSCHSSRAAASAWAPASDRGRSGSNTGSASSARSGLPAVHHDD